MSESRIGTAAAVHRRGALAAGIALAALCVCAGLISSPPGAGAEKRTTIILGQTPQTPDASCPEAPCRAVGSVTGFQIHNAEGSLPFRVPRNGEITGWTITLSVPTPRQRAFFNGFFGRPPEAHIAILKRVPGSHPPRYRLRRQSPIEILTRTPGPHHFSLDEPLKVRTGNVVAISIPTWASGFAVDLPDVNAWRASRERGRCTSPTDLRQGRPQQVDGSRRNYGCRYEGARLLYTATFVQG